MEELDDWLKSLKDAELATVIKSVSELTPIVRRGVPERLEAIRHQTNQFGEQVRLLDDWLNELLVNHLRKIPSVRKIYSEELAEPALANKSGRFFVTLDPLDGSSNALSNNAFGLIVGIYERDLPVQGSQLKTALYVLFGPATTLNVTVGKGVLEFVRHSDRHRFALTHQNICLPYRPQVVGLGGDLHNYPRQTLHRLVSVSRKEKLKLRYSGSLAADISQILHYGGAYAYPATPAHPEGKLRLYFEANPLAFLMEQACGAASDGKRRILAKKGARFDQRTPLILGNTELVKKVAASLDTP